MKVCDFDTLAISASMHTVVAVLQVLVLCQAPL